MMKSAPPRKGFAYNDEGHNEGYRDATGVTFRPGLGVFVDVAFEWLDPPVRGDRPAQLLRTFQHEGLNHGDYMLQSEIIWTYNYDDLILISDFESVVPAAVVEQMKEDPKCVLLSNHGVAIDFESITSDVSVTRAAADRPSKDRNAASVLGRVDMTFTKHKVPKPKRVTAFSLWRAEDKLSDLTAESLKTLVTTPIGLQPVEADDVACHLAIEVEECGGPLLPRLGETMRLGACDARIFAVSYESDTEQDGAPIVKRAYITGYNAGQCDGVDIITLEEFSITRHFMLTMKQRQNISLIRKKSALVVVKNIIKVLFILVLNEVLLRVSPDNSERRCHVDVGQGKYRPESRLLLQSR